MHVVYLEFFENILHQHTWCPTVVNCFIEHLHKYLQAFTQATQIYAKASMTFHTSGPALVQYSTVECRPGPGPVQGRHVAVPLAD